jgi:four helix bundle suffix protein
MPDTLYPSAGNYEALFAFKKSEAIFDITYYFCHKYLLRGDRTVDQMVQAARSGKQNIIEGSAASLVSKETEIKLIGVAKASLHELLADYYDYLRTREHRIWEDNSKEVKAMKQVCRKHNDTAYFMALVKTRPPETIANISICMLKQIDYMLFKLLKLREKQFLAEGGIRERMTRLRLEEKRKQQG